MPVVLVHAITESWRYLHGLLDRLPSTVHAYAPTQRGHGDADRPDEGYRVQDYAEDLVEFFDAVGIDRAVVVGTSSGGLASQMAASRHPERVAGLLLVSSPASLSDKPVVVEIAAEFAALEDPIDRGYVETFVRKTSPESISEDELQRLVDESIKTPARVWRESMRGLLDPHLAIDLERISAPTVVVIGGGDSLVAVDQRRLVDESATRGWWSSRAPGTARTWFDRTSSSPSSAA